MGGSATMEFGVYLLQFCQWVFQTEPKLVKATGTLNDDGVDFEMTAELSYGENKVAIIKTSSLKMLSNAGTIVGTNGTITVNSVIFFFVLQFPYFRFD